jgi:hypothetical protein
MGVSFDSAKGKYRVRLTEDGKRVSVGLYETRELADQALRQYIGDEFVPVDMEDKKSASTDWRSGLRLASSIIKAKREASSNQSTAVIPFPNKKKVSFINLGDLHFFSSGTDHDAIEKLTDRIMREPDLYIVCLGDIIENAINLRSAAEVQSNLAPTGYQLSVYEDWLKYISPRVLIATHDNHASERFEKYAGVDIFGLITSKHVRFFDGMAHFSVTVGKQEYKIMATHKIRGRSRGNPTYGQQVYGRFEGQDRDIIIAADSHVPGVSKYVDGDHVKLAVNVGTLNVKSAYARRYFSLASNPVFPVVTLYRDMHEATGFWTLDEWSMAHGALRGQN